MGESDAARVDVAALLDVARGYDGLADAVDAVVRVHLARLSFDGAAAGRAYTARGDALHDSIEHVGDGVRLLARAAIEIASALRTSADRYVDADARSARRVG